MEYVNGPIAGLNLLDQIKHDSVSTVARYKRAIGMGISVPSSDIFSVLGTRFFFTPEDIAKSAKQLEGYLT